MRRPTFKISFIVSLIVTVVIPILPEIILSWEWKLVMIIFFYFSSFFIYFFRLYRYTNNMDILFSEKKYELDELTSTHGKLKTNYRKINILLRRHENLSSRYIDYLNICVSLAPAEKKETYSMIIDSYTNIHRDELAKNANRKDNLDEENICD